MTMSFWILVGTVLLVTFFCPWPRIFYRCSCLGTSFPELVSSELWSTGVEVLIVDLWLLPEIMRLGCFCLWSLAWGGSSGRVRLWLWGRLRWCRLRSGTRSGRSWRWVWGACCWWGTRTRAWWRGQRQRWSWRCYWRSCTGGRELVLHLLSMGPVVEVWERRSNCIGTLELCLLLRSRICRCPQFWNWSKVVFP